MTTLSANYLSASHKARTFREEYSGEMSAHLKLFTINIKCLGFLYAGGFTSTTIWSDQPGFKIHVVRGASFQHVSTGPWPPKRPSTAAE